MVSRRSVRVKVMQLLYAQSRDVELTVPTLVRRYNEGIEESFELLLFTIYIFLYTTYQSVEDEKTKHSKHLPSERDKAFSAKLYHNPLIQSLDENEPLQKEFTGYKFRQKADEDFFRKIYAEFAQGDAYTAYITNESTEKAHREILLELFRFLRKNEFFNEIVEDNYANWSDDKSLVIGSMKKIIKALPSEGKFFEEHFPDEETAQDFGRVLLEKVCENEAYLLSLIEPTLKNWDADRLAIIDMILLKMAISEFLFFETIPTRVTLNEYVEISKVYSTPKSKDFINGILDRLMRNLEDDGQINKSGRGLMG